PFSLVMLWVSWPAVRNSWSIHETSPDPGGLPRYPIKAVILVSFVLLLLQGLSQLLKQVLTIRGEGVELPPSDAPAPEGDHGHGGHL
ncbi:MAG: TRAP transporter small permease subunit, partial [Gemmatimonadota bacterium]